MKKRNKKETSSPRGSLAVLMEVARLVGRWVVAHSQLVGCVFCVGASAPLLVASLVSQSAATAKLLLGFYVLALMSLFWAVAPISIYITALFPLILLPILRLLPGDVVASLYWNDAIVLFMGSFVLAHAFERVNGHRRLALKIVIVIGNRPRLILLGVMGVTAFLSMWMSNTATAALMVPLVLPIVRQLQDTQKQEQLQQREEDGGHGVSSQERVAVDFDLAPAASRDGEDASATEDSEAQLVSNDDAGDLESTTNVLGAATGEVAVSAYSKSLLISVAYSASLGGVSTVVGTGPNIAFVKIVTTLFPKYPGVSFGAWMLFAVPLVALCLLFLWAYFVFYWNRGTLHLVSFNVDQYRDEIERMGPMSFEEKVVLVTFIVTALLWLTRGGVPPYVSGWGILFNNYVEDGTVAILAATVLFLFPAKNWAGSIVSISDLKELHWDVILLLGSGFAVAEGLQVAGVTTFVANGLSSLRNVPAFVTVLLVTSVAAFWTEFSSNVATANILLPVVGAVAVTTNQNPLLLMIPTTLGTSLAFMFPIATPPNAIVFSSGFIRSIDMIKTGIVMNVFCILAVVGWTMLLGPPIWGIQFGQLPAWAQPTK